MRIPMRKARVSSPIPICSNELATLLIDAHQQHGLNAVVSTNVY